MAAGSLFLLAGTGAAAGAGVAPGAGPLRLAGALLRVIVATSSSNAFFFLGLSDGDRPAKDPECVSEMVESPRSSSSERMIEEKVRRPKVDRTLTRSAPRIKDAQGARQPMALARLSSTISSWVAG